MTYQPKYRLEVGTCTSRSCFNAENAYLPTDTYFEQFWQGQDLSTSVSRQVAYLPLKPTLKVQVLLLSR